MCGDSAVSSSVLYTTNLHFVLRKAPQNFERIVCIYYNPSNFVVWKFSKYCTIISSCKPYSDPVSYPPNTFFLVRSSQLIFSVFLSGTFSQSVSWHWCVWRVLANHGENPSVWVVWCFLLCYSGFMLWWKCLPGDIVFSLYHTPVMRLTLTLWLRPDLSSFSFPSIVTPPFSNNHELIE